MLLDYKYRVRPRWRIRVSEADADAAADGVIRRGHCTYLSPAAVAHAAREAWAARARIGHADGALMALGLWRFYEFADPCEFVDADVVDLLAQMQKAPRVIALLRRCVRRVR